MKKVILIKSELFKQGGLEKYTWQLARDFCALGCDITVLTSGEVNAPFAHPQLKVVSFPIAHILSVFNVMHFDRACSNYLADNPSPIVFSLDRNRLQTHIRAGNGVHAAYLDRRAKEEGFAKKVSFALNPLHRAILALERKGFEDSGLRILFTNSFMVKEEILRYYYTDPSKIQVIHNGVEWHALQDKFDVWESKREDAFQFLFIGHNFARKGLDKLLAALALIKQEHFHLSVVGKDKNSAYFEELAMQLGLAEKVTFFGPQKETTAFYQRADCLVVPSLYDPFANVTVEALAMGLFTLSSKGNGGHEILTPKNGDVIESIDDPVWFSNHLRKALNFKKTAASAQVIRESVKHLDFSQQLRKMTTATLEAV
jgi:UDP-glucose:(heptosyl)LPS alpha-1,3-glucosyltransferase